MSGADATRRLAMIRVSQSRSAVVDALSDPSPEVARAAISRLVELDGSGAATVLRERLLAVALPIVSDVAGALRSLGDATVVSVAIDGLTQEPYTRRLAAARALGVAGDERARGPLLHALNDQIAGVRAAALRALARLGPEGDTVAQCVRMSEDQDAQVRIAAVRAVMRIAPRAVADVSALASDPDLLVRREIAQHVAALPTTAAPKLFTDVDATVRQAAALAAGRQQIALLVVLVREDPSSDVRRAAVRALGTFDCDVATDGLLAGIGDRDALVRATAVQSLQRSLGHGGAVTRLTRALASAEPGRRRWSLYALAHMNAKLSSSDVWRLADDPEPDVRLAVISAAVVLLCDSEPLLLYMATDPDPTVRASAQVHAARAHDATLIEAAETSGESARGP